MFCQTDIPLFVDHMTWMPCNILLFHILYSIYCLYRKLSDIYTQQPSFLLYTNAEVWLLFSKFHFTRMEIRTYFKLAANYTNMRFMVLIIMTTNNFVLGYSTV